MLRAVDLVADAGVPVLGINHGQLGYLTQVEFFRDRWQSDGLGLLLFAVMVSNAPQ